MESSLEEAVDRTETFLDGTGIRCSNKKSELLLYRPIRKDPRPRGWKPLDEVNFKLHTMSGANIPRVDILRVLGMVIEFSGGNIPTLRKLATKTECMIALVNGISNKRRGRKEDNLLRLFDAFLMSHIVYVAATHKWYASEKNKLDTLIRKSIKKVLGVPLNTSSGRLLQ